MMYKCYNVDNATMGLIDGEYQRFESEAAYKEMYAEMLEQEQEN